MLESVAFGGLIKTVRIRDGPLHFSHEVGQIQKKYSSTAKIGGQVSCATNLTEKT